MFMPANLASPISTVSDPHDRTQALGAAVREASARGQPLRIVGADTKAFYGRRVEGEALSLAGHRGVIAYDPAELVITARAGTPLAEVEAILRQNGQLLAFEPLIFGEGGTLGGAVASGLCGARRPFAGAVRDSLLGVTVLDGQGQALRFGGTVFKNVAGFDAFRLMAGALGCLGVLLDVSLRVAPRAAAETCLSLEEPWPASKARLIALMRKAVPLSGAVHDGTRLHLRLSGAVAGVAALARELGGEAEPAGFWDALRRRDLSALAAPRLWRVSLPMTADTGAIESLGVVTLRDWAGAEIWLASDAPAEALRAAATAAGGHATVFRGAGPGEEVFHPLPPGLLALHQRIKRAFDPAGVFNPGRMYQDL
jgi:glycolate oxidase FAD binding subunit